MSERYIKLFKEEDETLDISLCDQALGLIEQLILNDEQGQDLDVHTTLHELKSVILKLKNSEVQEQSHEMLS